MNMEHKICMVTGANSGIGKYTAMELARKGAYIVMLCRNQEKAEQARYEIIQKTDSTGIDILQADLGHQFDVRQAAKQFKEKYDALDVLVNNAGFIPSERQETPEGLEKTLAVNHLGPFLLTHLLMESLQNAREARVVNVSSEAHRLGASVFDPDNLQLKTGYTPMKAYGLSKLCNIMFTHELAKRTSNSSITTNCLHPGVVGTHLASEASWIMKLFYTIGKPFMRSPEGGAQTSLYLATSDNVAQITGKYFKNKKISNPAAIAFDDTLTKALWDRSKELTGIG